MGKFTLPKIHAESSPLIIGALWPLGIFPSHSLHGIAIKWRKTQPVGLTFPAFSASNLGYLWCKTRLKVELPIFYIVSADSLHVEAITRVFDAAGDHAKMMEAWWKLGAGDSIKHGINGINGMTNCWMKLEDIHILGDGHQSRRAVPGWFRPVAGNRADRPGQPGAVDRPVNRGRLPGWPADRPVALTGRLPGMAISYVSCLDHGTYMAMGY